MYVTVILKKKTYKNTSVIAKGINKTSVNAANLNIFRVCNSTTEISNRAPHQKFCPRSYKFIEKENYNV